MSLLVCFGAVLDAMVLMKYEYLSRELEVKAC